MISRKYLLASICATLLTLNAPATTRYVDLNSSHPMRPYISWASAATTIQDAVNASFYGDTILVKDGVYNTGVVDHFGLTRVVITPAVTVRSVNGPVVTTIQGLQVGSTGNGPGAIRCAYLADGATLSGFTLTGGGTEQSGSYAIGGGANCAGALATVSNCTFKANTAGVYGGGAYGGTLLNCLIISNTTPWQGGGASGSILKNCLVAGNSALSGGGAAGGSLYNCTVTENTAINSAGGTAQSGLFNSIVYYNTAPSYANQVEPFAMLALANVCTTPFPSASLSPFTNAPLFVNPSAGDYRLQANSPCINAGNNAYMTNSFDLDFNPRISRGTVDVGAYEFQNPASLLSYVWAQKYGFPTDGSADFLDPDHDGATHWQECFSGTVPTNAASVLKLTSIVPDASGVSLTWNCVHLKKYYIERSTNLSAQPAFITINSNWPGSSSGTTTARDNEATGAGPYFYRIGVHQDR